MHFLRTIQSSIAKLAVASLVASSAAQKPQPPAPSTDSEAQAQQVLLHAKSVAIVDRGVDSRWPAEDVNYVQFFTAAMQRWGRYQVVTDPANADVVLELSGATTLQTGYTTDTDDDTMPFTQVVPHLRVGIRPPTATTPLWTVTVPVYSGPWHGRDLFAMSNDTAVSQLKLLDNVQLTRQEKKDLVWEQTRYHHVLAWVIGGTVVLAAGGVAALLIAKKNGEDQQHNFCIQNNIPGC